MLYESNRPKYLFNKYGWLFLIFIIVSTIISQVVENYEAIERGYSWIDAVFFILVMFILMLLFLRNKDKWKMVAIGKMKIVVEENGSETEYSWLDVEYIDLNRILGYYTLKLKGRDKILFTPYGWVTFFFGDQSDMGYIINKMKKDLNL